MRYKTLYLLYCAGMYFKTVFQTRKEAEEYRNNNEMFDFEIQEIHYYEHEDEY